MQVAIIVDGGFLKKKFQGFKGGKYPKADDVWDICANKIMSSPGLADDQLFRIFYYDCRPYEGEVLDPRTGTTINFGATSSAEAQNNFLRELAKKPRVAVRAGELSYRGLRVPPEKIKIEDGKVTIPATDLCYDFEQKQVDIKIGLDIAWIAQKGITQKIVLIAGDSDLIPAMKFARKEGVVVYLAPLGHSVKFGMIEHADEVVRVRI